MNNNSATVTEMVWTRFTAAGAAAFKAGEAAYKHVLGTGWELRQVSADPRDLVHVGEGVTADGVPMNFFEYGDGFGGTYAQPR